MSESIRNGDAKNYRREMIETIQAACLGDTKWLRELEGLGGAGPSKARSVGSAP